MRMGNVVSFALCLAIVWCSSLAYAVPVERLDHGKMVKAADVVVEGQVIGVTLTKRWVDMGYEHGYFSAWFLVSKAIKGNYQKHQTLEYFVTAYTEGKWKHFGKRFVYRGTGLAITPGTRLRVYLKWDEEHKRYRRVHFNSGFEVLEVSCQKYPETVGVPLFAETKQAEYDK